MKNMTMIINKIQNEVMEITMKVDNSPISIKVNSGIGITREGPIPHMHVYYKNHKHNCETCLTLQKAAYFRHNKSCSGTLPSSYASDIDKFLSQDYTGKDKKYVYKLKPGDAATVSNWDVLANFWNENSEFTFDKSSGKPDYSGYIMSEDEYKNS